MRTKSTARSEIKRAKFIRLAESRTTKALNSIRVIGNLSNRVSYEYTARDVEQIFAALQQEIEAVRERFNTQPGAESQTVFRLDAGAAEDDGEAEETEAEDVADAFAPQADTGAD